MKERLFYPPNSFQGVSHWAVETFRVDGTWRTYTEHETSKAARAQLRRMQERYPKTCQMRVAMRLVVTA